MKYSEASIKEYG